MSKKAVFIAATNQHVGKTTTCLGVLSGLQKRFDKVGFIKPVGQRHVEMDGVHVDKDVALVHERFDLHDPWEQMSPVILPSGFTRRFLDGEITTAELRTRILESFEAIFAANDYTVVEGTGHAGVGSIIGLSNADVAAALGLDVILVTTGGIGNAFDQLAINRELFRAAGAPVRGIIVNKVLPEKRKMILEYIPKALQQWDLPLAGCIPYCALLEAPCMRDYELLFDASLLSGHSFRYRHFLADRLVLITDEQFRRDRTQNLLIITHATREDIVRVALETDLERGIILTGHTPPSDALIAELKKAEIPALYAPVSSFRAMQMINSYTAKIRREDVDKVEQAIEIVEENLNFDLLCQ